MLRDLKREANIEEELFHSGLQQWQKELLATAAFFKNHGLCRNAEHAYGNYCAIGGYRKANSLRVRDGHDNVSNREAIIQFTRYLDYPVEGWNDERCSGRQALIMHLQYCALG